MAAAGTTLLDNFYLTPSQLASSPSAADGVPPAVEAAARATAVALAFRGSAALDAPPSVAPTAAVLLHRVYCRLSLVTLPPLPAAAAATWLALKADEAYRGPTTTRRLLLAFHRLGSRLAASQDGGRTLGPAPAPLVAGSPAFDAARAALVRNERLALRALGFILHVEPPHKLVLNTVHMLGGGGGGGGVLLGAAWAAANDALRTPLPVLHPPPVLAAGIVLAAANAAGVPLPSREELGGRPWWRLLRAEDGAVAEVASAVAAVAASPPPVVLDVTPTLVKPAAAPTAPPASAAGAVAAARAAAARAAAAAAARARVGGGDDRPAKRPRSRERRPSPSR